MDADLYTQKTRAVAFAISVATLLTCAPRVACADIFQWEYVNPANPSLGKQASTMLCPDGVGVDAEPGAILVNRNLTKAYLVGAGLGLVPIFDEYGEFVGFTAAANLAGANLSQADLSNASFWSATLNNANLSEADLSHAYFHWASLNGANLSQANLTHARFSAFAYHGADMPGASLSQANLSQANLTNAIFGGYRLYDSSYGYIITPALISPART